MGRRGRTFLAGLVALCLVITPASVHASPASDDGSPTASALLAKTKTCKQVSNGTYVNPQIGGRVPICGATGAYFWTSSMAVDCDGQESDECNSATDPDFQNDTSFHEADGSPLDAASLPFVVIPLPSSIWKYASAGIHGGDLLAVIYNGHVEYAVFGDEGPSGQIGEASYATANALGINPDPSSGGADSGVTYIVFPGSATSTIQDHTQAVNAGRTLAQQFVSQN
jgi:hypothetical protein